MIWEGLDFEIKLKQDAPTGYYKLKLEEENLKVYSYINFQVEDFKPAKAEMKINLEKSDYIWGEKLKADLMGWYLFGAPVNEEIEYKVSLSPIYFYSEKYREYNFNKYYYYEDDYYDEYGEYRLSSIELFSGIGKPDEKGVVKISIPLVQKENINDANLMLSGKHIYQTKPRFMG